MSVEVGSATSVPPHGRGGTALGSVCRRERVKVRGCNAHTNPKAQRRETTWTDNRKIIREQKEIFEEKKRVVL